VSLRRSAAVLVLAGVGLLWSGCKEGSPAAVRLVRLGSFDSPTYLAAPPRDVHRRFVVERAGRIVVIRRGRRLRAPFLDIRRLVQTGGESGLLSMAFAPDYARSRRFYIYYVDQAGAIRVDQFRRARRTQDRALPGSRRLVIRQPHKRPNHKGGQLQFGPDGKLYIGFGDGGGGGDPDGNAQNLHRLLGKILRIVPRANGGYRVPRDNPFVHRRSARPAIWAYGVRNPYRFSFTRFGSFTLGDVGEDAVEEVDYVPTRRRGRPPPGGYNFGWNLFEGRRRYSAGRAPGHVRPVLQRFHSQGSCSIIGGYVARDRALGRGVFGRYVYGDLCDGALRVARLRPGRARGDRRLGVQVPRLVSFGEDARGRLYAISLAGPVYRIALR
jgi:glucose/arabinose dehydrogenase